MSTVFYGFPDEEIAQQQPSALDSYLGGAPTTFSSLKMCCSAPLCPTCAEPMYFVLQLYCPIDNNHRSLYFFTCPTKECQESGRFFRVYRFTTDEPEQKNEFFTLFSNEWDLGSGEIEGKMEVGHNSTSNPHEKKISHYLDNLASPFKCFYINVLEDEVQGSPQTENLSSWVLDYRAEAEFIEEDEEIEIEPALTPFYIQHMASRDPSSGLEPIRYSFEGKPIFTSAPPSDEWEPQFRCPRCRRRRVFEVQLFPTINNHLHFKKKRRTKVSAKPFNGVWPLNFSTLIVFSCQGNCRSTSEKWMEECVLVQTEKGESVFVGGN